MRKMTLEALCNYLNSVSLSDDMMTVRDEVNAEYARLTAKTNANANAYEMAKDVVLSALCDVPLTVKEVYAKVAGKVPQDFSASKIQYAFGHYWKDDVVKHDNGKSPFTYTRKG